MRGTAPILAAATLLLALPAAADPHTDYLLHCSGCHRADGSGLPPDVPSLAGNLGRIVATAAGREYVVRVPGASQTPLSDGELAAVINWVLVQFNADTLPPGFKPLREAEVSKARGRGVLPDPHKFRREHWPELGGY